MNADTIRRFAVARGIQRGHTCALLPESTPPALPRAVARDIILASRPSWFWPLWFLLWIYSPDMAMGWESGWREGRAKAEAAARRRRVLSYRVVSHAPKLEA